MLDDKSKPRQATTSEPVSGTPPGGSRPKAKRGPNNPVPEVGSRWLRRINDGGRARGTAEPSWDVVVIDNVIRTETDIRLRYHAEKTGHRRTASYATFARHSDYRPAPPPEPPAPTTAEPEPATVADKTIALLEKIERNTRIIAEMLEGRQANLFRR